MSLMMFDNFTVISATDPEGRGPGPESQPTDWCTTPELAEPAHTAGPVQQPDQRPGESTHKDRQPQNTQPGWKQDGQSQRSGYSPKTSIVN